MFQAPYRPVSDGLVLDLLAGLGAASPVWYPNLEICWLAGILLTWGALGCETAAWLPDICRGRARIWGAPVFTPAACWVELWYPLGMTTCPAEVGWAWAY